MLPPRNDGLVSAVVSPRLPIAGAERLPRAVARVEVAGKLVSLLLLDFCEHLVHRLRRPDCGRELEDAREAPEFVAVRLAKRRQVERAEQHAVNTGPLAHL